MCVLKARLTPTHSKEAVLVLVLTVVENEGECRRRTRAYQNPSDQLLTRKLQKYAYAQRDYHKSPKQHYYTSHADY